jgi:beta-galactosidase
MGLLVMDESFDMWRRKKTKNDYARFFDEWHERDLADLIRRDRNHPSIFMWSIGNEVLEQWSSADADELTLEQANLILNAGHDQSMLAHTDELSPNSLLTRHLANIVHQYDTTRPITAGCNEPDPKNHLFKSGAIDVIGFNYHHEWVKDVPRNFPGKPFLLSESVSALQTRGFYMMPSDSIFTAPQEWWMPYTDPTFMCSAYDNMHASWSATHEATWDVVKHNDFVAGQFIWTGFDYIGEPTPYGFPARSSYFGIVDLAGLPKDIYYMYQSEWTDRHVLHLFPHWSWLEGQTIDLWCYYNHADEVELFVNGKSQGVKRKGDHDYHVMWRVTYEPGEVKVVARKNGLVVGEQTRRTPGAAAQVKLQVNYDGRKENAQSDGRSPHLVFVEADVTDADGNLCPWADNQIFFKAEGATIVGVDNGLQTSMERFKDNKRKAFMGKCIVVLQPTAEHFNLKAEAIGLKDAKLF